MNNKADGQIYGLTPATASVDVLDKAVLLPVHPDLGVSAMMPH